MAAPPPPPPARGMMSLYDDLLGGGSTDNAEPEKAAPAAKREPPKNPAMRFQPIIRRPQQHAKAKPKPKTGGLPNTSTASTGTMTASTTTTVPAPAAQPPVRTSLADWTADGDGDDDDYDGGGSQKWHQRGGRKRKKKRVEEKQQRMAARDAYVDWDEIYDPARPTNLDAYLHSDERIDAVRDWKAVLYAHRRQGQARPQGADDNDSSSDDDGGSRGPPRNDMFAPPPPAAFAPPASYDQPPAVTPEGRPGARPEGHPDGLVVSKPPVRFAPAADQQDHDMDDDKSEDEPALQEPDERRANRPGQAGFAARLMAKYGWTHGSGLGADESGIVNPLRHKKIGAGKDGAGPAFGRIVGGGGGKKREPSQSGQDGQDAQNTAGVSEPVSRVIVLRNMVTGLPDLADEVADGQLVQDIGEECGEQYGRIERVYVDVPGELVFIQFTEAVSALRAVNALNGRIFNGNAIVPSFYDADKFDDGVYE